MGQALKRLNISQVDALFANGSYPIEFLFFYQHGLPIPRLRNALRALSPLFWPIFGDYAEGDIVYDRFPDDKIFAEETVEHDFISPESPGTDTEILARLGLKNLERLLFIKVIRFKNGHGLIAKMNHLAGDGYSYFYFLAALAAHVRPSRVPFRTSLLKSALKPHHRRTVLRDFRFQGLDVPPFPRDQGLKIENHVVSRRDVLSLIKEAADSHAFRISSNDILAAKALRRLVGLHPERWKDRVDLTIPIDEGSLSLGTWQGVYLFEHRARGHRRRILLRCLGV